MLPRDDAADVRASAGAGATALHQDASTVRRISAQVHVGDKASNWRVERRRHHTSQGHTHDARMTSISAKTWANIPPVGQMAPVPRVCRYFREDLYSLANVTGWEPYVLHGLADFSRLDSHYTDPAQHPLTADTGAIHDLHDLDRDLFGQGVKS